MVAIIDKRAGLLGLYPTGKHRPEKPLEPITVIVPEGWRWNEQRREWDVTPEARLKHGRGMAQRSLLLRESVRLAPLRAYGSSRRRVTERHDQDMRVLSALVELLDAGERPAVPFPVDGLIAEQVTNSVRRLTLASPPYFTGPRSAAFDYPIRITAMTERGLVEGGIWPRTEDAYVAQLL